MSTTTNERRRWATRASAATSVHATATECIECGRVFDLADDDDADEWHYGHDCES